MQDWEVQSGRSEAMLLLDEGKLPEARETLDRVIDNFQAVLSPRSRLLMANCLIDRATVLRLANEWEAALNDLSHAQTLSTELLPALRRPLLVQIHLIRAKLLARAGTPVLDLHTAQRELDAVRMLGFNAWIAEELQSDIAFQQQDWNLAATTALRAAGQLEAENWPRGAAACRRRAGEALLELGQPEEADSQVTHALEFFERRGPGDLLSETRLALAWLRSRQGDHEGAWRLVTQALEEFESRLHRFRDVREQQLFLFDKLRFYDRAFDIGLATPGDEGTLRSWGIAERAKSFYLAQLLANAHVPLFQGVEPALVRELERAEAEMDECERRLSRLTPAQREGKEAEEIESRLAQLSRERSAKLGQLMRQNSKWLALRNPSSFDVQAFLKCLPELWMPLTYFWRHDGQHAILHIFTTDGERRPLHDTVLWPPKEMEAFRLATEKLSGRVDLLAPMFPSGVAGRVFPESLRNHWPADAQLLISPHGLLRGVPLHALGIDGKVAGERWPIQYTPGFGLATAAKANGIAGAALLVGCVQDGFGDRPLTGVETEIQELDQIWRDATRTTFAKLVPAGGTLETAGCPTSLWHQFEVLHFACHGVFPAEQPFDAALRIGDEAVRASELFGVKLNARIVTLSACALGRHARRWDGTALLGEEWIGLYLPLFYGGARALVVSLWDADSSTATEFMRVMHEALASDAEAAVAFQKAVAAVRTKLAPLWANWYLVGFPQLEREVA
jgi:tetratricopeptide (TPR) repeat protein